LRLVKYTEKFKVELLLDLQARNERAKFADKEHQIMLAVL